MRFFWLLVGVRFLCDFSGSGIAMAQMLVNPTHASKATPVGVSGILSRSSIDYEYEDDDAEIDRSIIGMNVDYQLDPRLRLNTQFLYAIDSEIDERGSSADGNGYSLGFGLSGLVHQSDQIRLYGHGFFNMTWDNLKDDNLKIEQDVKDLHLGSTAAIALSETVTLYGGLDFVFYSDGEVERKVGSVSYDSDAERDGAANLLAGLVFKLASISIRPQIIMGSEQTVAVAFHSTL